jgi:hypothetical protein
MNIYRALLIVVVVVGAGDLSFAFTSAHPPTSIHMGIMGDSGSDEYRADDERGGAYASATFNWDELLERYRGVDIGRWGTWGGTRRSGYEYNWAHSGATAEDVVNTGQATGLARQLAAGEVNTVVLYVGVNNFAAWNGAYAKVYNETLKDKELEDYIKTVVSSIAAAIDIVSAAGPVNIIVTNLQDPAATAAQFPDPTKRQLVTNAVGAVNAGILSVVDARPNAALVDLRNSASDPEISSRIDSTSGNLRVADQAISYITTGDEPHHAVLADGHYGTVIECLLANYIFVHPLNSRFGQTIIPFSDKECLTYAGISVGGRYPIIPGGPSRWRRRTVRPGPAMGPGAAARMLKRWFYQGYDAKAQEGGQTDGNHQSE